MGTGFFRGKSPAARVNCAARTKEPMSEQQRKLPPADPTSDSLDVSTEERLRGLINQVPLILFAVDAQGVVTVAEGQTLYAFDPDALQLVGRPLESCFLRFPAVQDHFRRALAGEGFTEVVESRQVSFEVSYEPIRDAAGEINGACALAVDVTERRSAERTLAYLLSAEEILADISTSFINIVPGDPAGLIGLALQALGTFTEVDRCYLVQLSEDKSRLRCTHEWCAPRVDSATSRRRDQPAADRPWLMNRLGGLRTLHIQRVSELPDGARAEREQWLSEGASSVLLVPIILGGGLVGYLGYDVVRGERFWSDDELGLQRTVANIFVNGLARVRVQEDLSALNEQLEARVTARTAELRHAVEALQESEEKYRALFMETSDAVFLVDGDKVVDCNTTALRMLGCESNLEVIGSPLGRFFPPKQPDGRDSLPLALELAEAARRRGNIRFEWWFRRSDDVEFPTEVVLEIVDWSGAEMLQVLVRDISQRKGEEEALRISEERFRALIEHGTDLIIVIDADLVIRYESPSIERILGYDQTVLVGQSLLDYVHADDLEEMRGAYAYLRRHEEMVATVEYRVRHTDGSYRILETVAQNQLGEDSIQGLVINCRDITQRRAAEEEIVRAQAHALETEKMAALGSLVAGVAHEINTPLGVGVTAASYLSRKTDDYRARYDEGALTRTEFEAYLKSMVDGAQMILANLRRAADLVQSFQQVAVDQSNDTPRLLRLADYVSEVLQSLQPKLKKGQHRVVIDCPEELEVITYPGAMAQILTNLVMNSVLHGFEDRREGEIRVEITRSDGTLLLRYRDNGCGIEDKNLRKIWEPFFSTKRGQGGSGLGLHIVYNLVTQTLNGLVDCHSRPGRGTEFFIRIPLSQAPDEQHGTQESDENPA